ncbi:uncharacterized protein LOC110028431 isoform X2 [Phalaenopsis equestris]|uniref:uncharacterized protein LOC110028431 isoform X2 n=1 Tax=Phalaenopsis equestris TaxID=78828 RepID=UPI0009E2ADE4|nr:uncharacterized protein LOC110028431 isoform X2 [Phalaenopsis equestris]
MFNWNDQYQVGVPLWNKSKKNEDQILPLSMNEGNSLLTFGGCRKTERDEARNTEWSKSQTSGAKHDFLNCDMELRSDNSCQDCNNSSLQMDSWPDLPYLSSTLTGGSDQDSVLTEFMNDFADASNLYPGVGTMARYKKSNELFPNMDIVPLSKPCSLSTGDAMQVDGVPEPLGHADEGDDSFLDYDWADIEDLDDFDKMFKNNDSICRYEEIHSENSQLIAGPGVLISMEQSSEHSDANAKFLLTKKADRQSQTWRSLEEEEGKGASFQGQNYSYCSEKQQMSSSGAQVSNLNPSHIIQSPPLAQECSSKNQTQDATTIDSTEEYKLNQSTPEVSYLEEQHQSQVMSKSINGRSIEVAIYHQLQYTLQKLDLRVKLNIRNSLFRLARNAKDRLSSSDRSCADMNNDEYEISMDEESNNHDRFSSIPDSERFTNPIDRIVAHLLFHNPSGSCSLPIGDGNVPMATSM